MGSSAAFPIVFVKIAYKGVTVHVDCDIVLSDVARVIGIQIMLLLTSVYLDGNATYSPLNIR